MASGMRMVEIVGARPQFIKLAPVLRAIELHNQDYPYQHIEEILIHTGQHYDYEMSQLQFEELGLKEPDYHLDVGSATHGYQTGEMLKRIEEVLHEEKPDVVVVYGDTNTTLAGALAAVKLHIPVAHVEAGLRSYNKRMPEEINRIITDHISNILFCPTETSVRNLQSEGIMEGVHRVGDVMYDAVLQYAELAKGKTDVLKRLGLQRQEYALATIHRAENTDNWNILKGIIQGLVKIGQGGMTVVFPAHPRTHRLLSDHDQHDRLRVVDPVSYLDMLMLEKNSKVILTDSGGIQKEAFFFRVPCITLREETEWVETVGSGWNVLAGYNSDKIVEAARNIQFGMDGLQPYGDGHAAIKIVGLLKQSHLKTKEDYE